MTSRHQQMTEGLNASRRRGEPILMGEVSTGWSARTLVNGGVDLLLVSNACCFRVAGHAWPLSMLANGNANQIVLDVAQDLALASLSVPVLAGVNAHDPFCDVDRLLDRVESARFAGVMNGPSVGLLDGTLRRLLDQIGADFKAEVRLIERAARRGLLTAACVFNAVQARQMSDVGADIIVLHAGLDVSAPTLDDTAPDRRLHDLARCANGAGARPLVLIHDGLLRSLDDALEVYEESPRIDGFCGSSVIEELPAEVALIVQTRRLKQMRRTRIAPKRTRASKHKEIQS